MAQPRRTGAQRVIFGVPRPRARGPPALPLPGPGAGPFPGREPLGVGGGGRHRRGVRDLGRWHFCGGGCLGSKVAVPGARAQSRGRRCRARSAPGARGRAGPTFFSFAACRRSAMSKTQASADLRAHSFGGRAAPGIRRGPRAALAPTHAARGPGSGVPSGGDEPPPLLSQPAPLQTLLPASLLRQFNKTCPSREPCFHTRGTHYVFGVKRYQHLKPHCPLGPKSL